MRRNCWNMARKSTEAKYPIKVVEDAFAEGGAALAETLKAVTGSETPRVAVVADSNVVQRTDGLGRKMGKFFQDNSITLAASPVVISGGEKMKADNMQSAMLVATSLLDAKVGANDAVIALGGGSVLDVAGYAAAQVRGGVKLVRMPTTVAAMIDAAFADYAAVDSIAVKDALRVRCEPAAVVVDTLFAKTILDGVWRAGFGEAVRYAAVCDGPLMKRLGEGVPAVRALVRGAARGDERIQASARIRRGDRDLRRLRVRGEGEEDEGERPGARVPRACGLRRARRARAQPSPPLAERKPTEGARRMGPLLRLGGDPAPGRARKERDVRSARQVRIRRGPGRFSGRFHGRVILPRPRAVSDFKTPRP